jgi:hypothetical protein
MVLRDVVANLSQILDRATPMAKLHSLPKRSSR